MNKRLEDMTLCELWELFPIVLVPHNPLWAAWAKVEIDSLYRLMSQFNPSICHIGSTAIPGILAKPIIDIIVEVAADINWETLRNLLESNGYICMSETEDRISFNRGYLSTGYAEKVYHIHVRRLGDNDEIIFRDYLNAHPDLAKDYETLKCSLLSTYKNDRDAYTHAKTTFVTNILTLAKEKKHSQ